MGNSVEIFRYIARERSGEIVAQREPLLIVVLKGEHAFVRTILIGQEFAKRVGIFNGRRLHRLEAVALIDRADHVEHAAGGGDLAGGAIGKAARQPRLEPVGFVLHRTFVVGCRPAAW